MKIVDGRTKNKKVKVSEVPSGEVIMSDQVDGLWLVTDWPSEENEVVVVSLEDGRSEIFLETDEVEHIKNVFVTIGTNPEASNVNRIDIFGDDVDDGSDKGGCGDCGNCANVCGPAKPVKLKKKKK